MRHVLEADRHRRKYGVQVHKDDADPGPVPRDAAQWFDEKKLEPSFDYRDVWKEEHAQSFTVAKAMRKDVLSDLRDAVSDSIEHGLPFEEFQRKIQPVMIAKGWWGGAMQVDPITGEPREVKLGSPRRLKVIYQTNMRTARAVGQWDRIEQTKESIPFLLYRLGPSQRHRPEHVGWDGTLLPVDDVFWESHFAPNGYGCRCHIRQVSRREADKLGGETARPDMTTRAWRNERTGETEHVPVGVDPAFNFNPGKAPRKADGDSFSPV
jgi:SPP1 gp7 family putative phage head morphogenesis protein